MGNEEKAPSSVNAGIDTLYLNAYYADNHTFQRINQPLDDDLQATFNDLQQKAKHARCNVETPWLFDEKPLDMLSHGTGKQWLWILHNDLINVQIGNGDYRGIIAHIRLNSEYLWAVNALHYILNEVRVFAHRLFSHEMVLVPSEVDLCADIANWPMHAINPLAIVAKARKQEPKFDKESLLVSGEEKWNGRKLGTLYVGIKGSPVHAKLYDKLKEIKDRGNEKAWFHDIFTRNGWDGKAPVTRLEVSFTREALRDLDIETAEDLTNNLKGLWAYAVGSETVKPWMRYTVPTGDSNQTRWPIHPMWATVQHAFDTLPEEPARDLIRVKKQQFNLNAATASITGYLSSRTVYQCERDGVAVDDMALETALADLYEEMEKRLQDKGVTFQELLQARRRRFYLREEKTREVTMKRVKSVLSDVQEAI